MPASGEQQAWVASVLGLQADGAEEEPDEPYSEDAFLGRWTVATEAWHDAMDAVDGQVGQLRIAMLKSGDPALAAIAEGGLMTLTANHKTPVVRSLIEVRQAAGKDRQAAASRAVAAFEAFRAYLGSDERIAALDDNAQAVFGVHCAIRDGITGGLDYLEDAARFCLKSA